MFTQPLMYKRISKQKPVVDLYANHLIDTGIVTKEEVQVQFKGTFFGNTN